MTEQEQIDRGLDLIKKQQKHGKNYAPGTGGLSNYNHARNFLEKHENNLSLSDVHYLLGLGTCMLAVPKQGGNDRCGLVQANCDLCQKLYLQGNELGVDHKAVEKYRSLDSDTSEEKGE